MIRYKVNKSTITNPNGNNEVHSQNCVFYNTLLSFEDLGYHFSCGSAVSKAKSLGYSKADGCRICSSPCHNG